MKPKAPFYVVVVLIAAALGWYAWSKFDVIAPSGGQQAAAQPDSIDPGSLIVANDDSVDVVPVSTGTEAPDTNTVTTVQEYTFKPSAKLPEVKGTAAYEPMTDNTVKFAINVWAGWAPIVLANNGFAPGKEWTAADGSKFKVEIVLMDDPILMRDAYATGKVHIGWCTLDMMPLLLEGFVDSSGKPKDSRIMPRIFQQVDWSFGGDGIVVRNNIKTVKDLRGKKFVLAENSPSEYFVLNMLVNGGVQPSEVQFVYTNTAFEAAAAFNSDKSIAACASWAPDIYNLSEAPGNRMLVTTATANKLIADNWFARADFAKDNPGIIEGLVTGIFDGMIELESGDEAKQKAAELLAVGYNLPVSDAKSMLADAHNTNYAENRQFFLNQNNPTNFQRVLNNAYYIYRSQRKVTHQPVPFDQLMDYSVIQKLAEVDRFKNQTDTYKAQFVPKTTTQVQGMEEILTNTIVINFPPNEFRIFIDADGNTVPLDNTTTQLFDTNARNVLKEISTMIGQFGTARVIIKGHADSSMRGKGTSASDVRELSRLRGESLKECLVNLYEIDPNQINVEGYGWDRPADPSDPNNHARNRRVEISIHPSEG